MVRRKLELGHYPEAFGIDVLLGLLWMEWIEAIRKKMEGFEDNELFQTTSREEAKLTRHSKHRHSQRRLLRAGVDYYGNSYWSSASIVPH